MSQEKRHSPLNSDVAAFATRAKVVYPINQKYRVSVSHSATACTHKLQVSASAIICWYNTELLPETCQPLADGASNPSLCERSKLPALPNEDSSSASGGESLSQEQDNDDSSQFVSSSLVPKCLQNQSFTRVSHYPQTLTQPR